MTPEITLGAIIVVPTVLLILLRVNAVLVFLSLCLGEVLVQFMSHDANSLLDLFSKTGHSLSASDLTIRLVLLLLPVALTTLFMIRTVHSHAKFLLNILPAAAVGLVGSFMVVPLLPAGTEGSITHSTLWTQLQPARTLIVAVSALICLLFLWMQRPKRSGHNDKHSKR